MASRTYRIPQVFTRNPARPQAAGYCQDFMRDISWGYSLSAHLPRKVLGARLPMASKLVNNLVCKSWLPSKHHFAQDFTAQFKLSLDKYPPGLIRTDTGRLTQELDSEEICSQAWTVCVVLFWVIARITAGTSDMVHHSLAIATCDFDLSLPHKLPWVQ